MLAMITAYSVAFHWLMAAEGQQHSWLTGFYWTLTVMSTLGFGDITFTSDSTADSICAFTDRLYMPAGAPNVNIKPQNRAFFVSAGPDRRFSTVVDNLYSYETVAGEP